MNKNIETVWIVTGLYGPYVDFRYTRKDMKAHHVQSMGYLDWKEAKRNGDKCIKAKLIYG